MPDPHHNDATRPGETVLSQPLGEDAGLVFIGRIRTPFVTRDLCPRQGDPDGPDCRVELDPRFAPALEQIEQFERLELLYWLHEARRDLLTQRPRDETRGTFSLRSPLRPNPIGTSRVRLIRRDATSLVVRGLDCLDGTPLLDIKPDRCAWTPVAPAKG